MPATDDPVRVLLAAAREGLLAYVGYTGGERYEVRVADATQQLAGGDVVSVVRQLRAIRQLTDSGVNATLLDAGDGSGPFQLATGRAVHTIPAGQVADWVDGYLAGVRRQRKRHAGVDHIGAIRRVLEHPGIMDQARMIILGLMYRDPEHEISMDDLAAMLPRSKKTVIAALSFGGSLSSELADRMIGAFGRRWRLTADGVEDLTDASGRPVEDPVEMPGLARLRLINAAARARRLRYVGQPSVNRARWSKAYEVAVGEGRYTVPAEGLQGWLAGLEAASSAAPARKDKAR